MSIHGARKSHDLKWSIHNHEQGRIASRSPIRIDRLEIHNRGKLFRRTKSGIVERCSCPKTMEKVFSYDGRGSTSKICKQTIEKNCEFFEKLDDSVLVLMLTKVSNSSTGTRDSTNANYELDGMSQFALRDK